MLTTAQASGIDFEGPLVYVSDLYCNSCKFYITFLISAYGRKETETRMIEATEETETEAEECSLFILPAMVHF